MKSYSCPSCGAELICDESTAATACPYCGNPSIVPGQFSGSLKPDFVLPFKLSKEDAVAAEAVSFADALVKAGKISADARDAAVETFKANPENARKIFGSVPERTKRSSLAGTQGGDAGKYAAKSWDELDRAGLLAELKANHPDLYEKKYKEMAASLHICRG